MLIEYDWKSDKLSSKGLQCLYVVNYILKVASESFTQLHDGKRLRYFFQMLREVGFSKCKLKVVERESELVNIF
ncbi:hypothetical protein AHAS_Ahas16G0190500 [Arachis hypogaea]